MLTSRRLLSLLLLLTAAALAYVLYQNAQLVPDRENALTLADRRARVIAGQQRLLAADSLFHGEAYRAALRAYEALEGTDSLGDLRTAVVARIAHARRLLSLYSSVDSLQLRAARGNLSVLQPVDQEVVPTRVYSLPLETTQPERYDSLSFALQRAEMQIRNLKGQLRRRSGGNYLTFESSQGNQVFYIGDVRDGRATGQGVALLSSGSRYQGEWRDNQKHGIGEFYWPDGAYYEGEYRDDERSGEGTYHFPSGEVFVGEWDNDLRNGPGVFYGPEGEVVAQGDWVNDELVD